MPAAECKTARSAMFSRTELQTYGYVKWNVIAIMPSLKGVLNANCWHGVVAVLPWQVEKAEDVLLIDFPIQKVRPGWVLVNVKAFGMNHSEQKLRLSEIQADCIQKPIIPGIEHVGIVEDASDSSLKKDSR